MAIFFSGLNDEETSSLTYAMANSGDVLDLSDVAKINEIDFFPTNQTSINSSASNEAIDTLVAMGLTRFDATQVVKNVATQDDTTEEIIKKSLKNLNR